MYQDLHSHTYYSFCGKDAPEAVVEAAIAGGLELFGITDHNYGIGYSRLDVFQHPAAPDFRGSCERTLRRYFDHINLIREKYADRIRVLRGIELCTLRHRRRPVLLRRPLRYPLGRRCAYRPVRPYRGARRVPPLLLLPHGCQPHLLGNERQLRQHP